MFNFPSLTKKDWVADYGFRKALEVDPGTRKFGEITLGKGRRDIVAYWQTDKSEYRLWELLCYMGEHTIPQTLAYFDLPADTVPFLRWVYNHVAHEERERVEGMAQGFFGGGIRPDEFLSLRRPLPHLAARHRRAAPGPQRKREGVPRPHHRA